MKTFKLYIYLLIITLLILNVKANVIREYQFNRKIKRQDTPPAVEPTSNADPQPEPQPQPQPQPQPSETAKSPEPEVVPTSTSDPVVAPTPSPVAPTPPSIPTTDTPNPPENTSKKEEETPDTRTVPNQSQTSSSIKPTGDSNMNNNNNNNNKNNGKIDGADEKDEGGLSGGIIALIVVGGIFALGVVILIFRSLLKLCTKKSKDYPVPVLNVVSNQGSSEQLNPQPQMSQDVMGESGYYNQSSSTIPTTGNVVGIDENAQYYQQHQYDNTGVDISNQYQQNGYQNGYVDNANNEYPLPQQEVIQPVRNYSSLRRPTATSAVPEVPLEGYDNPSMTNGEITDAGQTPHKVIINKTNNTPIEPGTIHKAQFPFNPNMDDELKLNSGDAVEIIEVYDDGWSYGKNMATNEVGVFPISYITGYNDPSNNF